MATIGVTDAASLAAALTTAQAGDIISLAAGPYGTLNLSSKTYADFLIIESAVPSSPGVFDQISVTACTRIRFRNISVSYPSALGADSAVGLFGVFTASDRIELIDSTVRQSSNANPVGGYGVYIRDDSTNCVVSGNTISHVANGFVSFGAGDLTVSGNTFETIRQDSMKFAGITGGLIENNTGATLYYGLTGDHQDFIQFQGSSSGITIQGNVSLPSNDGTIQGVFLSDGTYNDILIENNIIATSNARGVSVSAGSNVTARRNTIVLILPSSSSAAFVSVPAGGASVSNVFTMDAGNTEIGTNIKMQITNAGGPVYANTLYTNPVKGLGLTLEDMRPVNGGLADYGTGMGAEARLFELLETGTPVDPPAPPSIPALPAILTISVTVGA